LAAWLERCGIETVALESTDIYWTSLYEVLEQHGFEVRVVNARHVKHVPGRTKTDVLDRQWIGEAALLRAVKWFFSSRGSDS
jgi:transposase